MDECEFAEDELGDASKSSASADEEPRMRERMPRGGSKRESGRGRRIKKMPISHKTFAGEKFFCKNTPGMIVFSRLLKNWVFSSHL